MIRDNREFIDVLKKHKELVEINEQVHWDMEMGAIVRRASEIGAPAPLFLNVKDYPGSRVLGGPVANFKRIALAMGMDADTHPREVIREFTKRSNNPIKPVLVKDAPCQENVIKGDDVDLSMFPAPMVHGGDGGRYIGTWHFVLADDPDEGWSNWGMYRQMLHNERHMGGLILPASDMGKIKVKYESQGKTMPFATVIAPDPLSAIASTVSPPPGISEVDLAGGLMGKAIELVQCKTVDLRVPATAEIILEGEILKDVFVDEGPFGEYTGYRSSPRMPRAVYKVNCITFRNNPIFAMTNMGIPIDE
ncbi:MAG: UbiD family decarboxylase, partial [Dehalococcoidia bacterium]|nr:UbiD family decarboxylase [Dehalococcoidia bacterium]